MSIATVECERASAGLQLFCGVDVVDGELVFLAPSVEVELLAPSELPTRDAEQLDLDAGHEREKHRMYIGHRLWGSAQRGKVLKSHMGDGLLIDNLRGEISEGRVLVVVGSGVSTAVTQGDPLASWEGLLLSGVDRCIDVVRPRPSQDWGDRVRADIRSHDVEDKLAAAEKIATKLRSMGAEYKIWLRDTIGSLRAKDPTLIHSLQSLGAPITTTNYDTLIEEVTNVPSVTMRQTSALVL